jgi:hypothetical protein
MPDVYRSPANSECQRDHPRGNISRTDVLISRFCEESDPAYKRELESCAHISADAIARDATDHDICRHERGEKEETKKRIENIDSRHGGLGELNGSAIVADAADQVWVQPSGWVKPELRIDREGPEVRVGAWNSGFLQDQRLDAKAVIDLHVRFESTREPIPTAEAYIPMTVYVSERRLAILCQITHGFAGTRGEAVVEDPSLFADNELSPPRFANL